jgi:hypothetical protein
MSAEPILSLWQVLGGKPPERGDRSARGELPTRGHRYCEALTSASALGYYVYPPVGFQLQWDGHDIWWAFDNDDGWYPLRDAIQYPGALSVFEELALPDCRAYCPPWLTRLGAPGIIQIWSGCIIKTAPGWNTLIRMPPNIAHSGSFQAYEGLVETDTWCGPLFINIRLIATDTPIRFPAFHPLLTVMPLPRSACSVVASIATLDEMPAAAWEVYERTVVEPSQDAKRQIGSYAVGVRKRRAAER